MIGAVTAAPSIHPQLSLETVEGSPHQAIPLAQPSILAAFVRVLPAGYPTPVVARQSQSPGAASNSDFPGLAKVLHIWRRSPGSGTS